MKNKLKHGRLTGKLKSSYVLLFTFFVCISAPPLPEAAFNVYLRNGRIIEGADYVVRETGKIKINKYGITLELPETSIIKIEEYDVYEPVEKEPDKKTQIPEKQKPPEYPGYDKRELRAEQQARLRELDEVQDRYQSVLDQLSHIEGLEKKNKELQREARKKWSPRKARIAGQEKAGIDRELESLRPEKDSLLKEKKELESKIRRLQRY